MSLKSTKSRDLTYEPADATLAAFHASTARMAFVRACRGSGKSTTMLMQMVKEATEMPPQADGVRRSEFLISRPSYRDLEQSTVKSYKERFTDVPGFRPITGYQPWTGGMSMEMPDGTRVESTWLFMAISDLDLAKLTSYQCSSAWLNEVIDWASPEILNAVQASCGRYPSKDGFSQEHLDKCAAEGAPIYNSRVVCDYNGPHLSHWIVKLEETPPQGWEFFKQPPPLLGSSRQLPGSVFAHGLHWVPNPKASYARVQPKGYGYWMDLVPGSELNFMQSKILGGLATSLAGKRVYPEFSEIDHLAVGTPDLAAFEGYPLLIGIDTSGHNPSAAMGFYKDACLYIVDECVGEDVSFRSWVEEQLIPLLAHRYQNFEMSAVCDPSNPAGAIDKRTAISVLLDAGLDSNLAHTNSTGDRLESVREHMNRRGGFQIYPQAAKLLLGMRGAYRYKEIKGQKGVYSAEPSKDRASDVQDALQYLCLGLKIAGDGDARDTEIVQTRTSSRRAA